MASCRSSRSLNTSPPSWTGSSGRCSPGVPYSDRNRPSIPLSLLGGIQRRVWWRNNNIPYQFVPAPLFCHITRTGCKKCLQYSYVWEEDFDLVSDGGGSLQIGYSGNNFRRGSQANFVIGIHGPQGSVERTESTRDRLCDIDGSDGSRKRSFLQVPLRNWSVLTGNERSTSAYTYLPIPPVVHLPLCCPRDSFLTGGE